MKRVIVLLMLVVVTGGWADELRVAISTEPPGLDPTTHAAGVIKLLLHHNVYECLVQFDAQAGIHGQLATAWEVSEDGTEYTFHLREGVRFHDGTPCDAEAVRRSFLRTMDPETGHPNRVFYEVIENVLADDPSTVRFVLKEPYAPFLALLALGDSVIVPAHRDDLARHPMGTGPYRFVERRPADRLILVRNEHYYEEGLPKVERLVFRFIPDPSAQLAALRAGDVDLVAEVTPEIAYALQADARFRVISGPSNLVQLLAIHNARPPLDQLEVRQAIAHAIDRRAIIEQVFFGFGTPIGSHLTPAVPYYVDMTGLYPHDPRQARELLQQAGVGLPLRLRMILPGYPQHVRTGELIAAQLAAVGFEVRIELVDFSTWMDRVFGQADYDLTVIAHHGRADPALMLTGYSAERPDYYFRRGWISAELDALLEEGAITVDPARRASIYARIQEILAEDVVNYFIQDMDAILALRAGVYGVEVFPIYVLDFTRVAIE